MSIHIYIYISFKITYYNNNNNIVFHALTPSSPYTNSPFYLNIKHTNHISLLNLPIIITNISSFLFNNKLILI